MWKGHQVVRSKYIYTNQSPNKEILWKHSDIPPGRILSTYYSSIPSPGALTPIDHSHHKRKFLFLEILNFCYSNLLPTNIITYTQGTVSPFRAFISLCTLRFLIVNNVSISLISHSKFHASRDSWLCTSLHPYIWHSAWQLA